MTTTSDDTAQTWRDLTDQLTADQIDKFIGHEERWAGVRGRDTVLLDRAREQAASNLTDQLRFGEVAVPAGAARVYPSGQRDGRWSREFTGTARRVAGVAVSIEGTQFDDGLAARNLHLGIDDVNGEGGALTGEQARRFAAALVDAADELYRLAEIDGESTL